MGDVERRGDLLDDRDRPLRRQRAAGDQHPPQVGAVDQVHGHEQQPVLLAGVVDRDDVRVAQRDGDPRLGAEALAEGVVGRQLAARSPSARRRDRAPGGWRGRRCPCRRGPRSPRSGGRRRWLPDSGPAWTALYPRRPDRGGGSRPQAGAAAPTIAASRSIVCVRSAGVEVDRRADQAVDAGGREPLDPLGHLRLGADQRGRVDELVRDRLEGLVALAVEEQRLDLAAPPPRSRSGRRGRRRSWSRGCPSRRGRAAGRS